MFSLKRSFPSISAALLILFSTASVRAELDYSAPYSFSTLAGVNNLGSADGTGSAARFYEPADVAVDSAGNVYVADSGNNTIRKITPAGVVTTLAGSAGISGYIDGTGSAALFSNPQGITIDAAGNLYVTGIWSVRKVTPAGVVTTLAGTASSFGTADGIGSEARFGALYRLTVDTVGNVYVADANNHTIRKITSAGVVTTVAGLATAQGSADGIGSAARFSFPSGVAVDSLGNLYVADRGNHSIRKITPAAVVTTFAGSAEASGMDDGAGSTARFDYPSDVAIDAADNIYVADAQAGNIRKITPAGVVTTLAGGPGLGSTDGSGSVARFYNPQGVAVDHSGNVYVADAYNHAIRKISPTQQVTTLAGLGRNSSYGSVDGSVSIARFRHLYGVAVSPAGEIYLADRGNHTIRKITSGGTVSTLAGSAYSFGSEDGAGRNASFYYPSGVALDSVGNVYVADTENHTIRKITAAGAVTTLAGTPGFPGSADGTGSSARFFQPTGIAVDPANNIYVADFINATIRKISSAGVVTTFAGTAGTSGNTDGKGAAARFYYPEGVAVDASGNVYVADSGGNLIRKITPDGTVTTLAGVPGAPSYFDGTPIGDGAATSARFNQPGGIAVDASGNVYVADTSNRLIRKIASAGTVTTLAGSLFGNGSSDGIGRDARFESPHGIAVDAAGQLYVTSGPTVRKGQLPKSPAITTQPQNLTVTAGNSVQFSVIANAAPAATYQWYFNGNVFSGATTNTLSFTNARTADAGDYTVVVTNPLGTVTSNKATLTVTAAPTPTPAPSGGGGGGAINVWFIITLFALGAARQIVEVWNTRRE